MGRLTTAKEAVEAAKDPEKEHCILLYEKCIQRRWVGPCGDCLNKCTAQQAWDFDMCYPDPSRFK